MIEQFKQIDNFPNYYVSNFGYILSNAKGKKMKPLKGCIDSNGYKTYTLYNSEGFKVLNVHRLVAKAFIENKEDKECVDHIDENKKNNSVSNLQWISRADNTIKTHKNSRFFKNNYLTDEQVLDIFFSNDTNKVLAIKYNIHHKYVGQIRNKRTKKTLLKDLNNNR